MPVNDDFASAATLSGASGGLSLNTGGAGVQTGEPGHYNYNPGPVYPVTRAIVGPFATVWYKWTCPATDNYFFSTRDLSGGMATDFQSIQKSNSNDQEKP